MIYPIPDQTPQRIADILVRVVVPFFVVPENLLSDRGANLLSHLMMDVASSWEFEIWKLRPITPNAMGWLSSSTERWRLPWGSTQHVLVCSGTSTYLESCGHTEILHTRARERSFLPDVWDGLQKSYRSCPSATNTTRTHRGAMPCSTRFRSIVNTCDHAGKNWDWLAIAEAMELRLSLQVLVIPVGDATLHLASCLWYECKEPTLSTSL